MKYDIRTTLMIELSGRGVSVTWPTMKKAVPTLNP